MCLVKPSQASSFIGIQFSSVAQLCPTLCNPMDCNMPGFPAHHQLPEFTQTHVHHVSDAIQPSHPPLSPSPPAFNLFQHQDLFQWVNFSHQVTKVLSFSFRISPSNEFVGINRLWLFINKRNIQLLQRICCMQDTAIELYLIIRILWKWKLLSRVWLSLTPWTIQSMEFSRPEY